MNRSVQFATLSLLLSVCYASGELPKAERDEIAELIRNISPPHIVRTSIEGIRSPEVVGQDEAEKQRLRMARSKAAILELRKHLKLNTSVFHYPGLLTRGFLTSSRDYSREGEHEIYRLLVSATYNGKEGAISPYEFEIYFDDSGIITKINDVRWKK